MAQIRAFQTLAFGLEALLLPRRALQRLIDAGCKRFYLLDVLTHRVCKEKTQQS
jgi:hypothetical protein